MTYLMDTTIYSSLILGGRYPQKPHKTFSPLQCLNMGKSLVVLALTELFITFTLLKNTHGQCPILLIILLSYIYIVSSIGYD